MPSFLARRDEPRIAVGALVEIDRGRVGTRSAHGRRRRKRGDRYTAGACDFTRRSENATCGLLPFDDLAISSLRLAREQCDEFAGHGVLRPSSTSQLDLAADESDLDLAHGAVERWPIAGAFTISRGAKTEAVVVVAELSDGRHRGAAANACPMRAMAKRSKASRRDRRDGRRHRARPRPRRRCSRRCRRAPRAMRSTARSGISRPSAPDGRCTSLRASPPPKPLVTAYTISLATPEAMAAAAAAAADRPLLKVKLGGADDPARIAAVRRAAPAMPS